MARHFKFAEVNERFKKSFGIWRFRKTDDGKNDELLNGLSDPFYAADFRQFQVVHPDMQRMNELGAKILSMEMEHQDGHPSAIMAARISDEIAGTQFHPEADADSMLYHFRQQERKDFLINQFGESKYDEMMGYLNDPATIRLTRDTVIPAFLNNALNKLAESFN
jgi:homoserine trans-succinylase